MMDRPLYKELPIETIQLLDKNPRTITEEDLDKLCEDMKNDPEFMYQRPPLINLVNGIHYCYAGNQRVKAARKLGCPKIPCFIQENVPEQLQDERMLKDNLHRGRWDEEKLLSLNIEPALMMDFGFQDFEISFMGDQEPAEPINLTAPLKAAPPTMKITFENIKQMEFFEGKLKALKDDCEQLATISYSVSQGEI